MTRQGSFFPLRRDVATAEPVMFAYVLDTPAQREALQEEMLDRIAAIQALSETVASAQLLVCRTDGMHSADGMRKTPLRHGRNTRVAALLEPDQRFLSHLFKRISRVPPQAVPYHRRVPLQFGQAEGRPVAYLVVAIVGQLNQRFDSALVFPKAQAERDAQTYTVTRMRGQGDQRFNGIEAAAVPAAERRCGKHAGIRVFQPFQQQGMRLDHCIVRRPSFAGPDAQLAHHIDRERTFAPVARLKQPLAAHHGFRRSAAAEFVDRVPARLAAPRLQRHADQTARRQRALMPARGATRQART